MSSTAPAYRYLLCDLLTDRPLVDLPLSGVSFDRRISRTGTLSATLEAPTQQLVDTARTVHSYTGRSALYVYRDNQLWWGGIPWTCKAEQAERGPVSLSLSAATFDSYAHRRLLRTDLGYALVDQGVIIPDLWRRLQADPRGDIGVLAEDQPTGVLRDRTYLAADMAYYGKLIEDLGDVEDGPEHIIDVYLDGTGQRVKYLRVANRLGVVAPRVVFQRSVSGGGGVLQWSDTIDVATGGTTFQTRGASPDGNVGEDVPALLSSVHEDVDLLGHGWPLLDVAEDVQDVSDLDTLESHAAGLQAAYAGGQRPRGYTVRVGDTGWSPSRLGDTVRLKLSDRWHTPVVDLPVRPVACKVTAADRSTPETVELIFGDD